MVNLRYHLVSLTAVFLALGLGVVIGSAVVDQGSVGFLEDRLAEVEDAVEETNAENAALRRQIRELLEREELLADQAAGRVLPGLLAGRRVLLTAARGTDGTVVDRLRDDLVTAGAEVPGTVWFTDRLAFEDPSDAEDLVRALGLREGLAGQPERIGEVAALRLAGAIWPAALPAPLAVEDPLAVAQRDLAALRAAGFVEIVPTPGQPPALGPFVGADGASGIVMVAGPGAAVPAELLQPVVRRWAASSPVPVLTVTPLDDQGEVPEGGLVRNVRTDDSLSQLVWTVDHVGTFAGRLATVLVLSEPAAGVGHYGVGEGAQRLLPAAPA